MSGTMRVLATMLRFSPLPALVFCDGASVLQVVQSSYRTLCGQPAGIDAQAAGALSNVSTISAS